MPPTRRRLLACGTLFLAGTAGCLGGPETSSDDGLADGTIDVTSKAFTEGESIPSTYTCDGTDVSPPLSIGNVPDDAAGLAIVLDDPDAPSGTFTHWTIWNIPPDRTSIPEGVPPEPTLQSLGGARQGRNDFDAIGYGGPCPPAGSEHTYRFTVYALDETLDIEAGAGVDPVETGIEEHRMAVGQLTGVYG